jgi:hypothetical protein
VQELLSLQLIGLNTIHFPVARSHMEGKHKSAALQVTLGAEIHCPVEPQK